MFILLSKSFLFLNKLDYNTCENDGVQSMNQYVVFNLQKETFEYLTLAWPPASDIQANNNNNKRINFSRIVCGCVSKYENYIALCDDKKHLFILNRQFNIISFRLVKRICAKLLFKSNEETLLGSDKSGDIYEFDFLSNSNCPEKLLFGHCSIVLDFTMTKDSRYIIRQVGHINI